MTSTPDYLAGICDALRYAARLALTQANRMVRGEIATEPGPNALTMLAEHLSSLANRSDIDEQQAERLALCFAGLELIEVEDGVAYLKKTDHPI